MTRSFISLAAIAAALTACTGAGSETGDVKLGVDVAAIQSAVTTAVTTGTNDGSLVISRVRVLVAHAKVGYTGKNKGGPSAEIGPIVVDLSADEIASGAHRDFDLGTLPTGTYGGAEIEIQPLDSSADTSSSDLADFVTSKASVLVDGTYQGNAFSFAGHFLAEQGTDGDVSVDATVPLSLALTVDPSGWFVDSSGAAVDPSDATQHTTLADGICKSLDTEPVLSGNGGSKGGGPSGGGNGDHCVETGS